jgi:VTC domain-containing protein
MMSNAPPLFSRFEYKFRIPELKARLIAKEIRPFMLLDSWVAARNETSYLISSLYLDSPDYYCYKSTDQGEKNRFKLRIRWYGQELCDPVFLEEKRRATDAISKVRVRIKKEAVERLLNHGKGLCEDDVIAKSPQCHAAAAHLLHQIRSIRATPSCVVRYTREAYDAKEGNSLRITLDRSLFVSPVARNLNWSSDISVQYDATILEIKFRHTIPGWLANMVRRHHLYRESVPKYLLCVDALRKKGHMDPVARFLSYGRVLRQS